MLLMSEFHIDRFIRHRRAIMITGLVIMVLPLALGLGFAILFGLMLFNLGIYVACFRKWRSEPGLWMLAVLLTVTLGPCWAYFEYLYWLAIFGPAAANPAGRIVTWNQIRISLDASVSLLIFEETVRLAATVAIENWKRTKIDRQHCRT